MQCFKRLNALSPVILLSRSGGIDECEGFGAARGLVVVALLLDQQQRGDLGSGAGCGIGQHSSEFPRYLAADSGKLMLWMGEGNSFSGSAKLEEGAWHLLVATFDSNRFHLYSDGVAAGSASLVRGSTNGCCKWLPSIKGGRHFGGEIASLTCCGGLFRRRR